MRKRVEMQVASVDSPDLGEGERQNKSILFQMAYRIHVISGPFGDLLQAAHDIEADGSGVGGSNFQREAGALGDAGGGERGLHQHFTVAVTAGCGGHVEGENIGGGVGYDTDEDMTALPGFAQCKENVVRLGEKRCGLRTGKDRVGPVLRECGEGLEFHASGNLFVGERLEIDRGGWQVIGGVFRKGEEVAGVEGFQCDGGGGEHEGRLEEGGVKGGG